MTPERWQHINTLFHEALDWPSAERAGFLEEACAGDEDLRREVQSLISSHAGTRTFLEVPALEAAAGQMADEPDDSLLGTLIGSYQIQSRLGAGGMGEVYLAVDTKLDRQVAIKFLSKALEEDEPARRRQLREAKAAAGLDHPNICGIYEVATLATHSFIVMQYVDGETLAARIARLALPLRESLDVAIQIADALSLAHSRGIVHRDIKPQNVMITPTGQAKVLDFGLAKILVLASPEQDTRGLEREAAATSVSTLPGLIIGTAPYMSPEQAKGEAIDGRSDLFSLGAVLYECVTGRPAFAGKTPMETCAQVIHVDPPSPSTVNPDVPPVLDLVILKALAKDRDSRYQSSAQLRQELTEVRQSLDVEQAAAGLPPVGSRARGARPAPALVGLTWRQWALVSAVVAILAALSVPVWRRATPHRPTAEALQWYERGTAALRDGTYYKASKALEQAIALDDKFALAHARLGEAWGELDYAEKASREILRAQSLVRDVAPLTALDALHVQAITHLVLRDFGPAIETYQALLERAPAAEKALAYLDLGRAQEQHDDVKRAQDSYKHASVLATQDPAPYLRLGILYGRQQDLEGAGRAFETAEKLYRALSNVEGEAEVFYQRGFLFKNLNKLRDARVQSEQALKLSSNPANPFQQIRTLLVLSGVAAAEGDPSQAEQLATQAIRLARVSGMENQATNGLVWLGNVFMSRGDYAEAEIRYTQALDLAQRDNGRLNEAIALFSLGSLRSQQRKTDEALRDVQQAIPFFQQGDYRKWLSVALTLLGRIQRDRGEYQSAIQAFNEQLTLAERMRDTSQAAVARSEIGSVLERQEQYPEALAQFDESEATSRSLNATVTVGYAVMERAGILWQLGRFEEARKALREAAVIAGPAGAYKGLLAEIHVTSARLELGDGHVAASKLKSHQALDLAGDQYADSLAQATLVLGLAETRSGGARAGARLSTKAVEMAIGTGDPQLISSARLALAEALLTDDEPQRALETAQLAQAGFARFGGLDSEWRAWLFEAESKRRLGQTAAAHECASTAAARLASFEQRLGREAYAGFVRRSDVQQFRKRLDQQLNP